MLKSELSITRSSQLTIQLSEEKASCSDHHPILTRNPSDLSDFNWMLFHLLDEVTNSLAVIVCQLLTVFDEFSALVDAGCIPLL